MAKAVKDLVNAALGGLSFRPLLGPPHAAALDWWPATAEAEAPRVRQKVQSGSIAASASYADKLAGTSPSVATDVQPTNPAQTYPGLRRRALSHRHVPIEMFTLEGG